MAHVENFLWDPFAPVVMSVADYKLAVEMTVEEATQVRDALSTAIDVASEHGVTTVGRD